MSVRFTLALLCAALTCLLASCGGSGAALDHDPSARGIVIAKPGTGGVSAASPGSTIYFYDEGSSSTEGSIVKWEWNFGGGWQDCTATAGICSQTFSKAGTFTSQLRVTDSAGNKDTGKVKTIIADGIDADDVFIVIGSPDEGFTGDSSKGRYHTWRWRCISYDPDDANFEAIPSLDIRRDLPPGDPHFDQLVCHSAGSTTDFTLGDLNGDGISDDPSVKRALVMPHVLEVSGRSLSQGLNDSFTWTLLPAVQSHEGSKATSCGGTGYVGHVSILK
jgi:hypothetical protein